MVCLTGLRFEDDFLPSDARYLATPPAYFSIATSLLMP